jgi:hypothetical protein
MKGFYFCLAVIISVSLAVPVFGGVGQVLRPKFSDSTMLN